MSQHLPYIELDTVINDYLTESEGSVHKYFKLWHSAFRCMDELGMDFFYRVQSVKLPINPNMTVYLPADYLNWVKVGILNDNGSVIPLNYNKNLTTYADLLPDRTAKINDPQSAALEGEWNGTCGWNYWNGWGFISVFGVPSGEPFVGNFKVDTQNGVILLNERFNRDYIMLEYLCSPVEGQEYRVPVQFREAIIAWLWWKDGKARPITSHMKLGSARDAKREYYNERRRAIGRWKPLRIMDAYQASQEQSRLAIKT